MKNEGFGRPVGKERVRGGQKRVEPRLCGAKTRRPESGSGPLGCQGQTDASAAVTVLVEANR